MVHAYQFPDGRRQAFEKRPRLFNVMHHASIIVRHDGHIVKNRFGPYGRHVFQVPRDEGRSEVLALYFWLITENAEAVCGTEKKVQPAQETCENGTKRVV